MSGFAGVASFDGAPIDPRLLERMTAFLAFRGPDAQCARSFGSVGLGHALLLLDDNPPARAQPYTLDGERWVVSDARLDARADLIAALKDRGHSCRADATSAELLLRAYDAWGDRSVEHLLGDFSFAIWDAPRRRLFCARDQLGVKPFYYAHIGATVVFSNTLDCVRQHPLVSTALSEPAIADFLLFGANQDAATTTFEDIQRLPPAHAVVWSDKGAACRRYWSLPIDSPVMFARESDYTDRFAELLRLAVADRLPAKRAAVLMSGGVDSTTLAASAVHVARQRQDGPVITAITSVYKRLIPDAEGQYASLVAERLAIPIRFDVRDDETSVADWGRVAARTPEPIANPPGFRAGVEFLDRMRGEARVFLYGEGPDNALCYEWQPYIQHLVATRRIGLLLRAAVADARLQPRVPLWSALRHIARRGSRDAESYPTWLADDFAARCDCRARWRAREQPPASPHPVRPRGYASFGPASWQPLLEECDLQGAVAGVEFRHPFLDLRLLQYLLALPSIPWCRNKAIVRRAMRGVLPGAVLRRKKTSVPVSPDFARIAALGLPGVTDAQADALAPYVRIDRVPKTPKDSFEMRSALRPLGLGCWLHDLTNHTCEGRL